MGSKKHIIQCPHCSKQFEFVAPVKKKASQEETRLFKLAKKIWLEIRKGWVFGGAQAGSLKLLLSNIKSTITADGRTYSEEIHINKFKSFCERLPDFYKDKDLPFINSKYNEIVSKIQQTPQANGYHNQTSEQRFNKLQ